MRIIKKIRQSGVHDYKYESIKSEVSVSYIELYIPYLGRFTRNENSIHLYEHMCFNGWNGMSKEDSLNLLDKHFFLPNGSTTAGEMRLYGYLRKDRRSSERILFDMLTNSNMDEGLFQKEKELIKKERQETGDYSCLVRHLIAESYRLAGFPPVTFKGFKDHLDSIDELTIEDMWYIRDNILMNCCPEIHTFGIMDSVEKTQDDKFHWKRWRCPMVERSRGVELAVDGSSYNQKDYTTLILWNLSRLSGNDFLAFYLILADLLNYANKDSFISVLREKGICYSLENTYLDYNNKNKIAYFVMDTKEPWNKIKDNIYEIFNDCLFKNLTSELFEYYKETSRFGFTLDDSDAVDLHLKQLSYTQRGLDVDCEAIPNIISNYTFDEFKKNLEIVKLENAVVTYSV